MSRVIDTLYKKMNELHKSPSLIVNDGFMMSIFNVLGKIRFAIISQQWTNV
jgi:hypothetical protein